MQSEIFLAPEILNSGTEEDLALDRQYYEVIESIERYRAEDQRGFSTRSDRDVINRAGSYPLLTSEQSTVLFKVKDRAKKIMDELDNQTAFGYESEAILKGKEAVEQLYNCNLKLVISIAKKYRQKDDPIEDYIHDGFLGLERAVQKFDHNKGYRFSTYATWWIKQFIIRTSQYNQFLVTVPKDIAQQRTLVNGILNRLRSTLRREPTLEELSEETKINPNYLAKVVAANSIINVRSLDEPLPNSDDPLERIIGDIDPGIDDIIRRMSSRQILSKLFSCLNEKELNIINRIYFNKTGQMSEIAKEIGCSVSSLQIIHRNALRKMRYFANSADVDPNIQ